MRWTQRWYRGCWRSLTGLEIRSFQPSFLSATDIHSSALSHLRGETNQPHSVILSEAKDLARWGKRSFASLRMTSGCAPFQPRSTPCVRHAPIFYKSYQSISVPSSIAPGEPSVQGECHAY